MKKVALAAQMIENRIAYADHVVAGIPGERQLAEELGLSRTTVRKAVQQLMDQGTLLRRENGRLGAAASTGRLRVRTIGFVAPAGSSANRDEWRESLQGVVEGMEPQSAVVVRTVTYGHWADPVILETLNSLDGAFFMAGSESIPGWLITRLKEASSRVVILGKDYSHAGVPSVLLFPPAAQTKLFDHLYRLGHRAIDCLNTQWEDGVIQDRIAIWEGYVRSRGIAGQLHVQTRSKPVGSAYQLVKDALEAGRPLAPALFCTTGPAAIGAMRAINEAGLRLGDDFSVCAVNSEGLGRYLLKSLTALEAPPHGIYIRRALEWMLGSGAWQGPLLIQPEDAPLFEGESTGPAPVMPNMSHWETARPGRNGSRRLN